MASLTSRQFLSIYSISVRKKYSPQLDFSELISSSDLEDFFSTLKNFLKSLSENHFNDAEYDTVIGVDSLKVEPLKRRISGFITSGAHGVEGSVYDINKKEENLKNRTRTSSYV